jgi:uncharacterized protein (TIGR02996 family)
MHTDEAFLQKLLDNPADDTVRLVYADWLDEQDDPAASPKSEFLRLTTQLPPNSGRLDLKDPTHKRLQELAAGLDTTWLAVVSKLAIENCAGKRGQPRQSGRTLREIFAFVCDKQWEQLTPTTDGAVRFCESCRQDVHYCDTIATARQHTAKRHCVAVDLGIIRRENDLGLEPKMERLGRVSPEALRREQERERERRKPDSVSEARERRKQQAKQGTDD